MADAFWTAMSKYSFAVGASLIALLVAPGSSEAAAGRGRASRSSKRVSTNVDVRRGKATATVRHTSGARVTVSMKLPAMCNTKRVAELMADEVLGNPDAFWMHGDATVTLSNLPFDLGFDFDRGPGKGGPVGRAGGSGGTGTRGADGKSPFGNDDDDDDDPMDEDPMDGFSASIADVLATGQHNGGSRSGGGETCFDGTNLDVSTLVEWNDSADPASGQAKKLPNGKYAATTKNNDGSTTTLIFGTDGKTLESTTTTTSKQTKPSTVWKGSGGELVAGASGKQTTSVTKNHKNGSTTVVTTWKSSDGTTTNKKTQTTFKDGSSSQRSSVQKKSGGNTTEVSQSDNWDKNGKHTGGETSTTHNGTKTGGAKTGPDKTKNKPRKSGGGVSMTAEGTVNMPPMCIPDEAIAAIINWNKLQGALVNPAPHTDAEGSPTKADSASPCGEKPGSSFDANPAYLRPNKQGWAYDPSPHDRRGRGRER